MQPLRTYDYLCLSRGKLLDRTRSLSPEQYARRFEIGLGSLARTLTHIMICEWFYIQRLEERPVPPYEQWPIQDEIPPPFSVIDEQWASQAQQTRASIAAVRDWSARIEYRSQGGPRPTIITATRADIFTQLVLHEVHHRAQALNMLRHLGATLEDIDFNALMYTRRPAD